ncbi:hypothetical protein E5D57_006155 [Metarhizium anisopliae]
MAAMVRFDFCLDAWVMLLIRNVCAVDMDSSTKWRFPAAVHEAELRDAVPDKAISRRSAA